MIIAKWFILLKFDIFSDVNCYLVRTSMFSVVFERLLRKVKLFNFFSKIAFISEQREQAFLEKAFKVTWKLNGGRLFSTYFEGIRICLETLHYSKVDLLRVEQTRMRSIQVRLHERSEWNVAPLSRYGLKVWNFAMVT